MPALAKAVLGIGERFEQNGTRHPATRTSPSRHLFAVSRHRCGSLSAEPQSQSRRMVGG